jgi:hypothetical protein
MIVTQFRKFPVLCVALLFLLLSSCSNPLPEGAYRVGVEKISDDANSIVRKYTIETSSRRTLVLVQEGGGNSVTIAPDTIFYDERIGKAEVTVTLTLEDDAEGAHVSMDLLLERSKESADRTEETTAHWTEKLPVPSDSTLSSLVTETEPVGDMKDKTTLLRIESDGQYLEVVVE